MSSFPSSPSSALSGSTLTGGCYCQDIVYTLSEVVPEQKVGVLCHCRTCQISHTDRSFNMPIKSSQLKLQKGEPTWFVDTSSKRAFCGRCGSAVWSVPDANPEVSYIKIGSIDSASDFVPVAEIYVESGIAGIAANKDLRQIKHYEGMMAKEVDADYRDTMKV